MEFTSEVFAEFLQRHDVKPGTIAPHPHWQNGRCERHGRVLQTMRGKIDQDQDLGINSYDEFQQALIQSTHAKTTLSLRKGFSPEILVFGKSSRIPGSITSSENWSSLASAGREDAHGIAFRRSLALREKARSAYHQTNNDMALRRASLRRSRPHRNSYASREWVMMCQPNANGGYCFGPLKVINQDDERSIWATQGGKLHRRAPEHVQPVSLAEEENTSSMPPAIESSRGQVPTERVGAVAEEIPNADIPNSPNQENIHEESSENNSQSQDQPDTEPEAITPHESIIEHSPDPDSESPMLEQPAEDGLVTTHLLCCEDEVMKVSDGDDPCACRAEVALPSHLNQENTSTWTADDVLLAATEKKQRTEVKLSLLCAEERIAFQEAKETEVQTSLFLCLVSSDPNLHQNKYSVVDGS